MHLPEVLLKGLPMCDQTTTIPIIGSLQVLQRCNHGSIHDQVLPDSSRDPPTIGTIHTQCPAEAILGAVMEGEAQHLPVGPADRAGKI